MLLIWPPLCLPASVFLASAPPRVGESLHFGKHRQQRLGSRNHNSIRWGVQTQAVALPSSSPPAPPVNPVTFLLFQAENVKIKSARCRSPASFFYYLRNNFSHKALLIWFVAGNNWDYECWIFSVPRCGRSWACQHQRQHFHHVGRREHLERGSGPAPLHPDVNGRLHYECHSLALRW